MPWAYKRYGSYLDPIHKSHLNDISGDYGCPKAFRYKMDEIADGGREERDSVSGKAAAGTATHETLARALTNKAFVLDLFAGTRVDAVGVRKVFEEEYAREVGARHVTWKDDGGPGEVLEDRVAMIVGVLNDLPNHVHAVEMVEPGFIVKVGDFWLSGHIDLLYRPMSNPLAYAEADWKTSVQKPDAVELDHGWESGVYSAAVHSGYFVGREDVVMRQDAGHWLATCGGFEAKHASRYIAERTAIEGALISVARAVEAGDPFPMPVRTFGEFPTEIRHVHLGDYVPYKKAGSKEAKRPEDLKFYGLQQRDKVKYVAGDRRGPAWLPVRRTEQDVPRLESRLKKVVGMVRMGFFIDQLGEKCNRCPFNQQCLNSGYEVRGDERKQLEIALRGMTEDVSGLDAA